MTSYRIGKADCCIAVPGRVFNRYTSGIIAIGISSVFEVMCGVSHRISIHGPRIGISRIVSYLSIHIGTRIRRIYIWTIYLCLTYLGTHLIYFFSGASSGIFLFLVNVVTNGIERKTLETFTAQRAEECADYKTVKMALRKNYELVPNA